MGKSDYTYRDIIAALKRAGIRPGDTLFTHGNVGFFGRAQGAATKEELYALFKKAIFEVIGPKGTWAQPAFSYSFFAKKPFDMNQTSSQMGLLAEMMREDPESFRSNDPNFSVTAIGAHAVKLTKDVPAQSFGPNSFWDRFLKIGGKFCNFNFDSGSTFVHYVEKKLKVPYRYDKGFEGQVVENGRSVTKTFYHFVHSLEHPEHASDFRAFDALAKKKRKAVTSNLGRGQILVLSAKDTLELIKNELKKNPRLLTLEGAGTSDQQATE